MAKKAQRKKAILAAEYVSVGAPKVYGGDLSTAEWWSESGEWTQVVSSNVNAIMYRIDDRQLFVQFRNGSVYQYEQVSPEKAKKMYDCKSMGKFVHAELVDQHPYRKVR